MKSFLRRYSSQVLGILRGFDRLRFRGTFRGIAHLDGMNCLLSYLGILLKDFQSFVEQKTLRFRAGVEGVAQQAGRPVVYLGSGETNKEKKVDAILQQQGVAKGGVIAIFSTVEVCRSYEIYRNRRNKTLDLQSAQRKCLHYYVYLQDTMFGRVHVRMQTWFPFNVHVVINGREWLARQMNAARLSYERRDNSFARIDDFAKAQRLCDLQLRIDWTKHLSRLLRIANPVLESLLLPWELTPYWSVEQSEWATDIAFRSAKDVQELYPRFVQHAMRTFDSREVMRFLGRHIKGQRFIHGNFKGEVVSDVSRRPEGMRVKHRVKVNAIKMYDKQGSVLRVETTINDARDLKTYRAKEGDPKGAKQYRRLRKGVADLRRRAQLCDAANNRYLEALASADSSAPLKTFTDRICQPVVWRKRRYRALNPFAGLDAQLLQAIARGEFLIKGFRNSDIREILLGSDPQDAGERRRHSARISRLLALLKAHGLIKKIAHAQRYQLTSSGRKIVPAILAARETSVEKLNPAA